MKFMKSLINKPFEVYKIVALIKQISFIDITRLGILSVFKFQIIKTLTLVLQVQILLYLPIKRLLKILRSFFIYYLYLVQRIPLA